MSPHSQQSSTISLWFQVRLTLAIPFAVMRGVFSTWNAKRSWKRAAYISMLQEIIKRVTSIEVHAAQVSMGSSTGSTYRSWATKKQLPVTSEDIGEGAHIHWIGTKQLSKVLLYFHGGGFVFPATPDCFEAVFAMKTDISDSVGDVGVAFLEYSLAPDSHVPTQLRQASAALAFLISEGVSPDNIIMGGDSAGGNLALQVISQILHPLAEVPSSLHLSKPLAGVLLISPWVSFNDNHTSFTTNADQDILPPRVYMFFGQAASAGITEDTRNYFEPASAPLEWWSGLGSVTPKVLVTVGEKECLFSQVVGLSKSLEPHAPQLETVVEMNGVHEDLIFAFGAGEGRSGRDYQAIVTWLKATFV